MGKKLDLTNKQFGRLIVLAPTTKRSSSGKIIWLCRCVCGVEIATLGSRLVAGEVRSCGCLRVNSDLVKRRQNNTVKDLTGKRFGRLVAQILLPDSRLYGVTWECKCDCGRVVEVSRSRLCRGCTQSCGCLRDDIRRQRFRTHGLSCTKQYKRAKRAEYKAAKLKRIPPWADLQAIRTIYMNKPEGYHVDHIYPLRGELVSGLHVAGNLQYLPPDDNIRKHNKFTPEYIVSSGRSHSSRV